MRSKRPQRSLSPAVAAVLSLIPGLGHVYVGRPLRGLLVASPWIGIISSALLILVLDRHSLMFAASSSTWLISLTLALIILLVCHAFVVVDAFRLAGGSLRGITKSPHTGRVAGAATIGVLVVTTVFYGGAASLTYGGAQALTNIFGQAPVFITDNGTAPPSSSTAPDDNAIDTLPPPSGSSSASGSAGPTAVPVVYPIGSYFQGTAQNWAADGQLNVLLIGIDAGPGGSRYYGLRPDSMILLQVDIKTGRAAMYGIPRNMINVPLPPPTAQHYQCHCYGPGNSGRPPANFLIDYLWNEAANVHPAWYSQYGTGSSTTAKFLRGLGALQGAVSELANVQVDGTVVINLPGFVQLINALAPNGLSINVPYEVRQNKRFVYTTSTNHRLFNIDIKAGPQVMTGEVALEYARMRHVIGHDSDYYRMKRQQLVLRAVRDQINPCALLPQLPSILSALGKTIWTNLPQGDAPTIAALAAKVGTSNTADFSLDPTTTGASYDVLGQASLNKIHSIVAHGLDSVPAGISGSGSSGGGGGGLSC